MYTGQFGIALAGKGLGPGVPLWGLILAAFGLDLVSTTLPLVGLEGLVKIWAESAVGAVVVAVGAGGLYWTLSSRSGRAPGALSRWRSALLMATAAVLHLPADLATNELPLWPAGPRLGAALYKHPAADFAVEAAVVLIGWGLYRRSFPAGGRRWPAWLSLAMLLALQAMFSFSWRPW